MELTQMVELSSLRMSIDDIETICSKEDSILRRVRLTRVFLLIFSGLLVVVCITLTFYDKYDKGKVCTY